MKELKRENVLSFRSSHSFIDVYIPGLVEVMEASSSGENDQPASSIRVCITLYLDIPVLELESIDSRVSCFFARLDNGASPDADDQDAQESE